MTWKNINNSLYFLLFIKKDDYEIAVTDYVTVWSNTYTENCFIKNLKTSNGKLKLNDDTGYLQRALKILSNPEQLTKHRLELDNGKMHVSMTVCFGYPFTIDMVLNADYNKLYLELITIPLLRTVKDLRASQNELRMLLKRKDKEIEEYKEEGGEIVLRHLKTVSFDDDEHMKKYSQYEEHFGDGDMSTHLLEKIVKSPQNTVAVKQEPLVLPIDVATIKSEQYTQVTEEVFIPVKTEPVTCKQEVIKTEPTASHSPRKKPKKLDY